MQDALISIFAAAGIPSAVVGLGIWWIEHRIQTRENRDAEERKARQKETDSREARREQFEIHLLQSVNASMSLAEATAEAVQRIPDAHCNGDMKEALEYAGKVKRAQKDFMYQQGINNLF